MLCSDCGGYAIPDYNEFDEVKIILLGYCRKCGCGVYKAIIKTTPGA